MAFPVVQVPLSPPVHQAPNYPYTSTQNQTSTLIMSSSSSGLRTPSLFPHCEQGYTGQGTYRIIRSSPFSKQDWAEATDADLSADEWDEAEYSRQMCGHLQKQYQSRILMDLRRICKERKLRVRGNKDELVVRLAEDDVRRMYGNHGK